MNKVSPVLHRILVKPESLEEKTASGIILKHDQRKEAAVEIGTVVEVGTTAFVQFGTTAEAEKVVPGARVYFAKFAGKEYKDGEDRYLLLNDEDIVGVFK